MKRLALAASVALAGCVASPSPKTVTDVGRTEPELHVFATSVCPFHQAPAPESAASTLLKSTAVGVVSVFAGKLVTKALDSLAAYLGDDQLLKLDDASSVDHFMLKTATGEKLSDDYRCLVTVVAPANAYTYDASSEPTPEFTAWFGRLGRQFPNADIQKLTRLTGLRDAPTFYGEFDVTSGPSGASVRTVTRITPVILDLNRFSGDGSWRLKSARDILVNVTVTSPELGLPVASLTMTWTAVTPQNLGAEWMLHKKQPWIVLPAAARKPPEGLGDDRTYLPVNVAASYSETAHPRVLAKALAEAIKSQESSISTAASDYAKESLSADDSKTEAKGTAKKAN